VGHIGVRVEPALYLQKSGYFGLLRRHTFNTAVNPSVGSVAGCAQLTFRVGDFLLVGLYRL